MTTTPNPDIPSNEFSAPFASVREVDVELYVKKLETVARMCDDFAPRQSCQ